MLIYLAKGGNTTLAEPEFARILHDGARRKGDLPPHHHEDVAHAVPRVLDCRLAGNVRENDRFEALETAELHRPAVPQSAQFLPCAGVERGKRQRQATTGYSNNRILSER